MKKRRNTECNGVQCRNTDLTSLPLVTVRHLTQTRSERTVEKRKSAVSAERAQLWKMYPCGRARLRTCRAPSPAAPARLDVRAIDAAAVLPGPVGVSLDAEAHVIFNAIVAASCGAVTPGAPRGINPSSTCKGNAHSFTACTLETKCRWPQ